MKKYILALALALSYSIAANATTVVGQCVSPKMKIAKNGHFEFKNRIYILAAPGSTNGKELTMNYGYTVKAESGKFIQIVAANDQDPDYQKVIGWVKRSDFQTQDPINCI